MRNYEILNKIYEVINLPYSTSYIKVEIIKDLLQKERPEFSKDRQNRVVGEPQTGEIGPH